MNGAVDCLPLVHHTVRPEWIDYNGHMSEAFYVLVFGYATDAMMIETGLHAGYRESTGCSLYTVEAHIRYLSDVPEGARLAVRTRVLGVDAKKLRFTHELFVVDTEVSGETPTTLPTEARPVATTELLALHVDQAAGRATGFPEIIRERLAGLREDAPSWAGRAIVEVPSAAAAPA
ncbi:thioesterase family protein [Streptomyces finlayi]|uniref:thioesterase family protein n=1 Tax=Streptomyces finlayi TaxID=67296 RepID=UPI001E4BD68B|nr:thioesterase family protein [Streptomyces finlayi]